MVSPYGFAALTQPHEFWRGPPFPEDMGASQDGLYAWRLCGAWRPYGMQVSLTVQTSDGDAPPMHAWQFYYRYWYA